MQKTSMDKIKLNNIRVFAHHGCLKEETRIGSDYLVNISLYSDLATPTLSDDLKDTIDYVLVNKIVSEEMKIPSKLLEHVAQRISTRLFKECSTLQKTKVEVAKINPPINGDVASVSITLCQERE